MPEPANDERPEICGLTCVWADQKIPHKRHGWTWGPVERSCPGVPEPDPDAKPADGSVNSSGSLTSSAADPEAPRRFVRCERTDMHGPHPITLTCPGIHTADLEAPRCAPLTLSDGTTGRAYAEGGRITDADRQAVEEAAVYLRERRAEAGWDRAGELARDHAARAGEYRELAERGERALRERDATIAELRGRVAELEATRDEPNAKIEELQGELAQAVRDRDEAWRTGLGWREAVARVRTWAASPEAAEASDDAGFDIARPVLAALDGMDGGETGE